MGPSAMRVAGLEARLEALGHQVTELDAAAVRAELDSPAFLGGTWYHDTCALVDPARLARGLRQACLDAGVRIYEQHLPPARILELIAQQA